MRNRKSKNLAFDMLESRCVPTVVVLADIDTGAIQQPGLGNYLEAEYDFRNGMNGMPVSHLDTSGHGTAMAADYASIMQNKFGIQAHVVELIAGDANNFTSDAIGRAEQWVARVQAYLNSTGQDVKFVVALPVNFGITLQAELQGRAMLAAEGVPFVQAAGNTQSSFTCDRSGITFYVPMFIPNNEARYLYDQTPNAIIATAYSRTGTKEADSYYTSRSVNATVPSADYATSGATMTTSAWVTEVMLAHPGWSGANVVYQVSHQGLLRDF